MGQLGRKTILDRSITSIENLSNEIFYDIFDYLNGCEIYQAFSNLNLHYQQLLRSSSLLFKLKLDLPTSTKIFLNNYQQILQFHKNQILSIHLLLSTHNNDIIQSMNIDSSFNHLESLDFSSIQPNTLKSILSKLIHLPRFFSLTIDTWHTLSDLIDIYRLIFQLPKLKYLRFIASDPGMTDVSVSLEMADQQQTTSIKHLIIDHSCTFKEFFNIISYTPELYRLEYMHKAEDNINIKIIMPVVLSNLTYFSIFGVDIMFDDLEILISKINGKLKILSVTSECEDMTYLDANRWEEFILKYIPQLKNFYLKYTMFFHDDDKMLSKYLGKSDQFFSSFWIERQWIFEVENEFDMINYSICPYKKKWYEFVNSSIELSKSMQLLLGSILSDNYWYLLEQNILHILSISQIYHLEISEEIHFDALINILGLLPKLNSLKISSLSLTYSTDVYEERIEDLSFRANTITKVYLKKMTDVEEIYFLIDICPRLTFLKIESRNNMNTELVLQFILTEINTIWNSQLRLLCFHNAAADDKMIEKLDQWISSEKLLINYSVKRVLDNIYLYWN